MDVACEVFSNDFWGNPLWGQSWTHKSYRPLAVLSFAWQFRFLGEDADLCTPKAPSLGYVGMDVLHPFHPFPAQSECFFSLSFC